MSTETVERPRSADPGSGLGDSWRVIVRNDNHNTLDHVAETLAGVLPSVTVEQGRRLAGRIHNSGEQLDAAGLTMAPLERG
jgi:ATP-dependent Clp protease adaptor protein ClpS